MKKYLLIGVLLLTLTGLNAKSVLNEGFESGDLMGWTIWKSMPSIEVQQLDVKSGSTAVTVGKNGGMERNVKLAPGRYILTYYSKFIGGDEGSSVRIKRKQVDGWKFFDVTSQSIPQSSDFVKSKIEFKVKNEGLYKIVVHAPYTAAYVIDDIVLSIQQ